MECSIFGVIKAKTGHYLMKIVQTLRGDWMSEKRFKIKYGTISTNYPNGKIFDNKKQHSLYLDEVVDLLNEQQATISALKEENEQLRGINKEIGDDLYNCRLNKDIVSEKLKLWQDTLAEYDIYTIKDFKELMKNDN